MSELFPDLIAEDQDTDIPDMSHVRSYTLETKLCGLVRPVDPSKPIRFVPVDCVVCMGLWRGMSPGEQLDLIRFWGGA